MGRPINRLRIAPDRLKDLKRWLTLCDLTDRQRMRGEIILLSIRGVSQNEISEKLGVSRPTICKWMKRFKSAGVGGFYDEGGRWRKPISPEKAKAICRYKPRFKTYRATAQKLGVAPSTVHRVVHAEKA